MAAQWKEYVSEWARALVRAPQLIHRLAFRPRTIEEELVEASLKGNLRRALAGYDLLSMGTGFVIGSGVFILTGQSAQMTGPAVIVSYLLSGIAACLAATCYAEFAVEYPVAGAGFTYIMVTFGELPAWITVSNLLLEYILGTAAIARGFSRYVARLAFYNSNPSDRPFLIDDVDWMAFGCVLVLTAILSAGVRESSLLITGLTVVHFILLATTVIAGFTQADASNLSPFLLGGTDNMFAAAAVLYFAYAGFDVVATAAEESRKPLNVPRALLGTTVIATVTYVLMSLMVIMMAPIPEESGDPGTYMSYRDAVFSTVFQMAGMKVMYYVSCVTALNGIITSLLVGLYGMSRIVMVAARDWLIPPFFATIFPRTQTPLFAQLVFGGVTAIVALLGNFDTLSDLVSISSLLVMIIVANALLFRRYYPGLPRLRYSRWGTVESAEGKSLMPFKVPGAKLSLRTRQCLVATHLVIINLLSMGLTVYFQARTQILNKKDKSHKHFNRWSGELFLGFLWMLSTLSFQLLCPLEYEPPKWSIPWWLMPWLPSTSILLMTFTAGSLQNRDSYIIFACWLAGSLVVYFLFSMPMSYIKHHKLDYVNTEEMNVVELTYEGGRWQPRPSFKSTLPGASSSIMSSFNKSRKLHPLASTTRGSLAHVQPRPSSDGGANILASSAFCAALASGQSQQQPPRGEIELAGTNRDGTATTELGRDDTATAEFGRDETGTAELSQDDAATTELSQDDAAAAELGRDDTATQLSCEGSHASTRHLGQHVTFREATPRGAVEVTAASDPPALQLGAKIPAETAGLPIEQQVTE